MFYEGYCYDTRKLAEILPDNSLARRRFDYLLDAVAPHAIITQALPPEPGVQLSLDYSGPYNPEREFFVVNLDELSASNVGESYRPQLKSEAVVNLEPHATVLAIRSYAEKSPIGNALVLSHELEHVTEREVGLYDPDALQTDTVYGREERRAYALNANTFRAFDGTLFDQYAIYLPFSRDIWKYSVNQIADDPSLNRYLRPPKNTFMEEAWHESSRARLVLLMASFVTHLEALNWKRGEYMASTIVGKKIRSTATNQNK